MEAFFGSWKQVSSENFDEYLGALELSSTMKKMRNDMTPVIIISQEEDNIVIQIKMDENANKSVRKSFRLGEECELSIDSKRCKSVMNLEEGKLVHLQKWDDKESTITHEIQDGKMIATFKHGDVVSMCTFESI